MKSRKPASLLIILILVMGVLPITATASPSMPAQDDPEIVLQTFAKAEVPVAVLGANGAAPMANHPEDVLWDQYANWNSADYAAQDFEAGYDTYDIFAADDFANAEPWTIDTIVTRGGWGSLVDISNAVSIRWWICPDNAGEPLCDPPGDGNEFWTISLPPSDPQVQLGVVDPEDIVLTLNTPINLPAGTWWLVHQVELEFGLYGQWGISGTSDPVWGNVGKQNNPGGGFGMGTGWWGNTASVDFMYRLEGTAGAAACTWVELVAEDFETWPPAGWTIVNNGGACVWESTTTTGRTNYAGGDGAAADADSDFCGSGTTMDTGLQSPAFDLTYALTATLTFSASYNDITAGGDYAEVNINESGAWTSLLYWDEDHNAYGPGESVSIDLPVGDSNAYVEFYYVAPSWDWWYEVDQVAIYACLTQIEPQVRLTPPLLEVEGCAGEPQEHVFNLENLIGANDTFSLTYTVHTNNGTLTGPDQIYLGNGANQDFLVELTPNQCLPDGTEVGASIFVVDSSGAYSDTSWITKTTIIGGWESVPASAPGWAGSGYPTDGCAAMDAGGDWVTYIMGDQSSITGFWGYDHNTNTWFNPGATNTPADRWAPEWAYDADTNLCYMTGGATAPGGGDLAEAWVFDPVANAFTQLPSFTSTRDFHDSWVGTLDGTKYLCIGGGVNASSVLMLNTQCFDIGAGAWNAENADMDPYPTDPFGSADGTLHADTGDQFWYVGGAKDNFATVTDEAWYWDDADDAWHLAGNTGVPRYRVEGDFKHGAFYQLGGSSGGFTPTPDVVRGEYVGGTWVWSQIDDLPNARMDNVAVMIPPYTLNRMPSSEPEVNYNPETVLDLVGDDADAPAPAIAPQAAPVDEWVIPEAVLWDNGPLITHPGDCSGQDASRLQTGLGMNTLGFGNQFSYGYRMADDFVVDGSGWTIDAITFFGYQTNAPSSPSPITGIYFQIWDGSPDDPGSSVVFGDLTTNRLVASTWPNMQRDSETSPCAGNRYIFANTASAGVNLPAGTYWLDWMTDGSGASGPWAPPVTIVGQTTTGNALQYTTAWAPALDTGTSTQQDLPFIIEGSAGGGAMGTLWSVDGYGDNNPDYVDWLNQCPPCQARGWLEGHVYDMDNGMAVPCTDAVVHVESGNLDLPVDPSGYYWVELLEGVYEVSATAPGYSIDGPHMITVTDMMTTTWDFNLNRPFIEVIPTAFSMTVPIGPPVTETMLINNLGGLPLDFNIFEMGSELLQFAVGPAWTGMDSLIAEELASSGDSKADVFIAFAGTVDLSQAATMAWDSRGEWTYSLLQNRAYAAQARIKDWLDLRGIEYRSFVIDNTLFARLSQSEIEALSQFPEVVGFRGNHIHALEPIIEDAAEPEEGVNALAWGIDLVEADMVWSDLGVRGEGIVVANIDTGVEWDHDALVDTFNCPGDPTDPACWADPSNICGGSACDNNGHGTHTMGTMTASDDPSLTWQAGMAPDSTWIACKGCESSSCSDFALNACADWILAPDGDPANRPHIVNNSWGGGPCDNWYLSKVQAWVAAGVFPAFSSGNPGSACGAGGSPGDYIESFSSGATDATDTIAGFSGRGPSCFDPTAVKPNVTAPGVAVCSSVPGNGWSCGYSGTSMASPHTAGLVALMWSANPSLAGDIAATADIIQETAICIEDLTCGGDPCPGGNMVYGHGRIDAYAAVSAVASPMDLPWVWTSPISGTVPIYDSVMIDVTFWCTQTHTLTGTLQVRHNDPCQEPVDVPLYIICREPEFYIYLPIINKDQ